jgi:hypothetical protein
MNNGKNTDKEIVKNVNWFKKFSLLKKLKLSISQQSAINILRGMEIAGIKKST